MPTHTPCFARSCGDAALHLSHTNSMHLDKRSVSTCHSPVRPRVVVVLVVSRGCQELGGTKNAARVDAHAAHAAHVQVQGHTHGAHVHVQGHAQAHANAARRPAACLRPPKAQAHRQPISAIWTGAGIGHNNITELHNAAHTTNAFGNRGC